MGIKGIYKEIGPGKRVSLTKLAIDHLEQTGRPLRIAIDISIWQFQVQAARGGSNPAIRTLFYRVLRLLSLSIQPIFVFDGPNKPVFKRNKRSGRGNGLASSMAKRLIRLFGLPAHDAPGEAEAECALLQQHGIVDAVLSEDVDTIMFGCTRTLRNWSAEGKGTVPTHMSEYNTSELRQGESGLDREGMVLVALMSGGDYLPEGIPGAGIKVACEAARAGFGKSLCNIKRSDGSALNDWRENLIHELQTNEGKHFRTKHKALTVPEDFPNFEVLRYYTHPVVSPASTLERLRNQCWDQPLDILGLREFVRETFDWSYRGGAIKFIRVLAPCLLVKKIMKLNDLKDLKDRASQNVETIQEKEAELVRAITNRREHFSTDATAELRISFTPTEIVGYNFEEEPEEEIAYGREGLALNSDDEFEAGAEDGGTEAVAKAGPKKPFSPNEPDLFWMPETIAKLGIPLMVEDWEEAQRAKLAKKKKTRPTRQKAKLGGMTAGALDKFVKVTKDIPLSVEVADATLLTKTTSIQRSRSPLGVLHIPSQNQPLLSVPPKPPPSKPPRSSRSSKPPTKPKKATGKAQAAGRAIGANPWTIAGSQTSSRIDKPKHTAATTKCVESIFIPSSPIASPTKDASSPVGQGSMQPAAELEHSLHRNNLEKRRSSTPVRDVAEDNSRRGSVGRPCSPTPQTGETTRRKLARTESMPTDSPRGAKNRDIFGPRRGALMRARTVAVETDAAGCDHSDDDSDLDLDLPPLSNFMGRIPKGPSPIASTTTSSILPEKRMSIIIDSSPAPKSRPLDPPPPSPIPSPTPSVLFSSSPMQPLKAVPREKKRQSKISDAFGARMTKMYVPRKSEPGFFKEVDVTVAEAEHMSSRDDVKKWRRSDVSIIDLTGED